MTIQGNKKVITSVTVDVDVAVLMDKLILKSERVYRTRSQVINVALYQFFKTRGEI